MKTRTKSMAKTLRGILFDWDGVLNDSLIANFRVYNKILHKLGMKPLGLSEYLRLQSPNWYEFYKRLGIRRELWGEVDRTWMKYYTKEKTSLHPDAKPCLIRMKQNGYALGLVSNGSGDRVRQELKRHRIDSFFDVIVCSQSREDLKPSPVMLLKAINELGLDVKTSVYVGDSPVDVIAARRARMSSVAVARYGEQKEILAKARPRLIVDNLDQLTSKLSSAQGKHFIGI